MLWKFEASSLLKEFELANNPVIVTVNKFDEQSADDFRNKFSMAQNTGQKVIPVVIDSYGGQVYSLKAKQCLAVLFFLLVEKKVCDTWILTRL